MKRKPMKSSTSKRVFKKNTGIHSKNHINPRAMRGGIRLG
jgi:hypothetical protein